MTGWPVRETDGGCLLTVRVTPKAARDQVEGLGHDDTGRTFLKVRVRAVPEDGAANRAVCLVLAKALGLPKSALSVSAGQTSRIKQLSVDRPLADIAARLDRLQ